MKKFQQFLIEKKKINKKIMKLIKPSAQIIEPTGYTIDDIYKSIELAGRVFLL